MQTLSYRRQGKGPALVLVHGYLGGSAIWSDQLVKFSRDRDVICPDLAGFGDSAELTAPDTIQGHACHVLELLNNLGVSEFELLGHSMGGMIAQEIVRLAPDRIRNLVLYGTGPQGVLPGRFETIAESRSRFLKDGISITARKIAATWFLKGEEAEAFPQCLKLGGQASMQAVLASLQAWEHWDGRDRLSQIQTRTLVIWGSRDRSYIWSQPEALWRGIPEADIAVVPNCAHNVHLEQPNFFNALIAEFFQLTPVVL